MARTTRRQGFSLVVVMVAISMSLVLTLAFLRTQTTVLQVSRYSLQRDLALQAAHTGAAIALERMHAPDWAGVSEPLSGSLPSDRQGMLSYVVEFHSLPTEGALSVPDVAALYVVVQSMGVWQSNGDSQDRIERHVEIVARLVPRIPGREVRAGDSAAAHDVAPNPGDYDQIQSFALFAGQGGASLRLGPRSRIEGDVWLGHQLQPYQEDLSWSSNVREALLTSLGNRFAPTGQPEPPHPLGGRLEFDRNPPPPRRRDLEDLGIGDRWGLADRSLNQPAIDQSAWHVYRLYAGGFEYDAVEVPANLRDNTLLPTPENPLGIFYRNGPIWLEENVRIQGTLFSAGRVTVEGENISLGGFNWPEDGGGPIVADLESWPRLPAVVADEVEIVPGTRAVIDGAVVVRRSLKGSGGDAGFVEVRGPLSGERHALDAPPAWTALSNEQWNERQESWQAVNEQREADGDSPIAFVDWLADAANFAGWPLPYSEEGLTVEPTFHLQNPGDVSYRWSPPLFEAYPGSGDEDEFAGYRWKIISWREVL